MTKNRLLAKAMFPFLLFFLVNAAFAQNRTITGKVTGENDLPLIGATVVIQGSRTGTSSDKDGNFTISVSGDRTTLVVSYVGYEPQQVTPGNQSGIRVALHPDKSSLNEVVVVGYGTQKRKDLTGSVSSVSGAQVKNLPVTNVTEALQGRAAGVEIIKNSGQPDATPTIIIRGLSSPASARTPVYSGWGACAGR